MSSSLKIRQYSDAYTFIASCLLFPLHEKLKKSQIERLAKLLIHAYENVPYYKDLFN